MHSFIIKMCRSCLSTNVDLKEYMMVEDKAMTCFDAVKIIFPNVVIPANFGYGYSLCEVCINLLKEIYERAAIFERKLSESHNAYGKYMKTLNFSNHDQFSILIVEHVNKEYLPTLKTDQASRVKQSKITSKRIPTNDAYFQDILNYEDLNCDTYNDNFLGELDSKLDIKENILLTTSQQECKNMGNVIIDSIKMYDEEVFAAGNHNQTYLNVTENTLHVRNIKQEPENLILNTANRIDKDIVMSDKDSYYRLDSKLDVKEHIIPWECTKKEHEGIEPVYVGEEQCKNDILASNLADINFVQEKTINGEEKTIDSEAKTSPIILTKHKVDLKRKRPYKGHDKSSLIKQSVHIGKRSFKCVVCEASFTTSRNLNRHKHIHTGERPYKCDICEKSFIRNSCLIGHKRNHTGERPYKCDVCEKSFIQNSILIRHKLIHTGERPYKCDVCEKSFIRNSILIRHKLIHTGERPYKCDVCEKSFIWNSNFIKHKRTHTGERPYKCDICEKRFVQNSILIGHKRIHTEERSYKM